MEANIYTYMNTESLQKLCDLYEETEFSRRNTNFLEGFREFYLGKNDRRENRDITGNADSLIDVYLRDQEGHGFGQITANNWKADKGKKSKVFSDVFSVKINFHTDWSSRETKTEAMKNFLNELSGIISERKIGSVWSDDKTLLGCSGPEWQMAINNQIMNGEVPFQYAQSYWDAELECSNSSESMKREIELAGTINDMIGAVLNPINESLASEQKENNSQSLNP